jgi:RimJ/RimL family protein N-acetyltransferase
LIIDYSFPIPHHLTSMQAILQYYACDGLDLTPDGLIVPRDQPLDEVPRLIALRHPDGYSTFVRHDLPVALRDQIRTVPPAEAWRDHEQITHILTSTDVWRGTTYLFPDLSPANHPDAVRLTEAHRPLIEQYAPGMQIDPAVWAIIGEDRILATCESSRENDLGGEAWVQTLPAFRGRGYARQVTAAWARHLQAQGKTPYYSHRRDTLASAGVARSLGLRWLMDDVAYR